MSCEPRLLDRLQVAIRAKHYSYRTEQTYVLWVRRYILSHDKRHPSSLGPEKIRVFLEHLAVRRRLSASSQNQALAAILFLYREVLRVEMDFVDDVIRAKRPARLPVVLSRAYASPTALPQPSQGSLPAGRAHPWPGRIRTRWTTNEVSWRHRILLSPSTRIAWSHRTYYPPANRFDVKRRSREL